MSESGINGPPSSVTWSGNFKLCGIRVVGKDSWKEREVGKFLVGKFEVGKLRRSWKEPSEVGKNPAKLESSS